MYNIRKFKFCKLGKIASLERTRNVSVMIVVLLQSYSHLPYISKRTNNYITTQVKSSIKVESQLIHE